MVGPFLELKNVHGTGIDGKMIIECALPVAHSSVKVHHKIETRAPYDIRSLVIHVLTFSGMAKTYFPVQISSLLFTQERASRRHP